MLIGGRTFDVENETYICGILNVTPDSFSDGGKYINQDAALKRAEEMLFEGAALIDIGGESTRPGYLPVSAEEECERVIPVLKRIKDNLDIPISIDTSKVQVAREALLAGADVVNDIWGLSKEKKMGELLAKSKVCCILMHNRDNNEYSDLISDVINDLKRSTEIAIQCGVSKERIILDPGIGFAKNYEQNLKVLKNLKSLHILEYPLLLGASNKSVIGESLNLPVGERLEGTLATTALAVENGYSFVRVHDVRANKRLIDMLQVIKHKG